MLARSESSPVSASSDVETGCTEVTRQASDPVTKAEVEDAESRFKNDPFIPIFLPQSMQKSIKNLSGSSKFINKINVFGSLRLSSKKQTPFVETFLCAICGENESIANSFVTKTCPHEHRYCLNCMKHWINTLIEDGTTILHCPDASCVKSLHNSILDSDEVQQLTTAEVFSKYTRYKNVQNNDRYRECPSCSTSVVHEAVNPEIICAKCNTKYCFMHGNAHPTMTCDKYAVKINNELKSSAALINRITKKCPQCKAPTEKNNGCNHITCKICQSNWCWLCGRSMQDVTEHYTVDSRDGCPGLQFTDPGCNCRYLCWQHCFVNCNTIFPCCSCASLMTQLPDSISGVMMLIPYLVLAPIVGVIVVAGGLVSIVFWIPAIIYAVNHETNPFKRLDCSFYYDVIYRVVEEGAKAALLLVVFTLLSLLSIAWAPIGFLIAIFLSLITCSSKDEDFWPIVLVPFYLFAAMVYNDDS